MAFPHTSRGKKIVALIDKHNNSPNEDVTPNETSNEIVNQTSHEMRNLSNQSSSSPSSSSDSDSSRDSDSSDDTFIEDSDDSVKDPMYIPPEQLFQKNSAKLTETIEYSIPLPSTSMADRNITISEPSPLQRSSELPTEQTNDNSIATNNFFCAKNKTMIAIYLFALQKFPNLQTITHKYLIKVHTQNESDAAHSLIERQVKKLLKAGPMYSPEAFIGAIKMARKKPEPFHVNEMCTEDFVDWKDACTQMGVNLTKDEEGNSVKIGDIKILKVEKDKPRILFYKNSYGEEEFKKAEIIRKKKRIDVNVKKAYDCKPGISDRKKADLLDLLNKNLIPQFYAQFYNSL